jgi:hypothetical protein
VQIFSHVEFIGHNLNISQRRHIFNDVNLMGDNIYAIKENMETLIEPFSPELFVLSFAV